MAGFSWPGQQQAEAVMKLYQRKQAGERLTPQEDQQVADYIAALDRAYAPSQQSQSDMAARGVLNPDGTYNWKNDANAQEAARNLANQRPLVETAMPKPNEVGGGIDLSGLTRGYENIRKAQEQAQAQIQYAKDNPPRDDSPAARNARWSKTLPSHLKPKIEKDKDGNEVVTMQGSLLNRIMKDMYAAGEENAVGRMTAPPEPDPRQLGIPNPGPQALPKPPQPYGNVIQMQDTSTPQAEVVLRELQKSYPGRSPDELIRILRGG